MSRRPTLLLLAALPLTACSASTASEEDSIASKAISDIQRIERRPDGSYDVICRDGRKELATEDEILRNTICSDPAPRTRDLVISQIYAGGGNFSAAYRENFIEIFNPTPKPRLLQGLSLQYSDSEGDLSGEALPHLILEPGGYLLVKFRGSSVGGGQPLPPTDVNEFELKVLSLPAGKVALVSGEEPLGCGSAAHPCSSNRRIIDFVGYGQASDFEGTAAAPQASFGESSVIRRDGGCTDTGDNRSDFLIQVPPKPRDSRSPTTMCP